MSRDPRPSPRARFVVGLISFVSALAFVPFVVVHALGPVSPLMGLVLMNVAVVVLLSLSYGVLTMLDAADSPANPRLWASTWRKPANALFRREGFDPCAVHPSAAALRCPFCHDGLTDELFACSACKAVYHDACLDEAHGCATLGCVNRPTVRA